MTYEYLFDTYPAQDGAMFGDLLFRFNERGDCRVYAMESGDELSRFTLDRTDFRMPHSNAVMFGAEKYQPDDEFPLLYTNIYNTYAGAEERHEGELCVHRIFREGNGFSSALVGLIRIGFTEDRSLWKSLDGNGDVRPYGNFAVDRERDRLYAFVMRDKEHVTRYFSFAMPCLSDGVMSDGISVVTLTPDDILDTFDGPYMNYMQGACAGDGVLYSVEGFGMQGVNLPRMQVVDMQAHTLLHDIAFGDIGLEIEPELVDFADDHTLIYSDATGKIYRITSL